MRITLIQNDPKWLGVDENLAWIESQIELHKGSHLYLLPEMFNTAYIMDPKQGAEQINGKTIETMKSWASKFSCIVGGSIPMQHETKYTNSFIFVGQEGVVSTYDKVHLFTPAGEAESYFPGQKRSFVTIGSSKILPLICYDLRFPYISYNNDAEVYDILIYAANWPTARIHHWRQLLIARAIENQAYCIGLNRVGHDENGFLYPGSSMAVDYSGKILIELGEDAS
ncbi:MAG: hypothetical protein RLZZ546_3226, partial [Bacteroidota bacterium]